MLHSLINEAWYYTSAVNVGHFEWITMYAGAMDNILPNQIYLTQATIP